MPIAESRGASSPTRAGKPRGGRDRSGSSSSGTNVLELLSDNAETVDTDSWWSALVSSSPSSTSVSSGTSVSPASVLSGGASGSGSGTSTAKDRQSLTRLQPYVTTVEPEEDEPATAETPPGGYQFGGQSYYPREADDSSSTWGMGMGRGVGDRTGAAPPKPQVGGALEAPETQKYKARRTREMTWEEYNELGPLQRAGIDFNTMLVQAREKDLKTDYDQTDEEFDSYTKKVEEMFGEEGGTTTFAPETLAMLQELEFNGEGRDFDDFLGLKVALTEKDLKQIVKVGDPLKDFYATGKEQDITPPGSAQTMLQAQLAEKTSALQQTMAEAGELIANWRKSAMVGRNPAVAALGGDVNEVNPGAGFGDPPITGEEGNIHTFFQDTFQSLTLKSNDEARLGEVLNIVDSTLKPQEKKAFLRYVDDLTRYSEQYQLKFGKEGATRSADEIRALLNLDNGGDGNAA